MEIRMLRNLKFWLLALTSASLSILLAPSQSTFAAGATTDPRFGVVNAFEAPDSAYESGASWELLTVHWDELQPNGPSDWNPSSSIDDWIGQARTNSREVVMVVTGTPAWATDGTPGAGVPRGLGFGLTDANNLWASFIRQAISYYSTRGVSRFVVWDTPSIPPNSRGSTWEGTVEEYYHLVKVTYQVAKSVNPGVQVHLGGISDDNPGWFKLFLDVAVTDPTAAEQNYYFDVVTVHVFNSADRVYTLTANPSALMNQSGVPLKPVWINQTNARPAIDPAYPPDTTFRVAPNTTLEQQASFVIQSYGLAFSAGADRVAVYRMADNLEEDGQQAFGLVRKDGDPRPALTAYQIVTQEFSGFELARRVDEETLPLIDYVRLTFPTKVTHVAWALTQQTATLIIPARSEQATLIDIFNNRSLVKPQGGVYRLVVGGADCNDPNTVGGCLIGGVPWILVEQGVNNPLNEAAPKSSVELGGVVPTPDLGSIMTATALAMPTSTPTDTPVPPSDTPIPPTAAPTEEAAVAPGATTETTQPSVEVTGVVLTVTPTLTPEEALRPKGTAAILPYLLMGLGALVIGGGVWFFLRGGRKPSSTEGEPMTEEAPTWEQLDPVEPPQQEEGTQAAEAKGRRTHKSRKTAPLEQPPAEETQPPTEDDIPPQDE
jgi:hypothetical protein